MSGNTLIVNSQSVPSEAIPVVIKNIDGVVVNVAASIEVSNDVGNPLPISSQQLPANLGPKTAAQSLPVTLSSDGTFAQAFGTTVDAEATTDTGTFSLLALFKRLLGKLPASLGAKTAATSLSVTPASDAQFTLAPAAYRSAPTVTRPANVTPYSAGNVVGATAAAITFPAIGLSDGHIMLTSIDLLSMTRGAPYDLRGAVATMLPGAPKAGRYFCNHWVGLPFIRASATFGPHHFGAICLSLGKDITRDFFSARAA